MDRQKQKKGFFLEEFQASIKANNKSKQRKRRKKPPCAS